LGVVASGERQYLSYRDRITEAIQIHEHRTD
jgi:hypothetical protein